MMAELSPEETKLKIGALAGSQDRSEGIQPGRGAKTQPALFSKQRALTRQTHHAATNFIQRDCAGRSQWCWATVSSPQAKQAGAQSHLEAGDCLAYPLRQCCGLGGKKKCWFVLKHSQLSTMHFPAFGVHFDISCSKVSPSFHSIVSFLTCTLSLPFHSNSPFAEINAD